MKNNLKQKTILILSVLFIMANSSCSEDLNERNNQFEALNPTQSDENAGNWKTFLLTSANEFPIDVPIASTSPAFTRELNEIKSYQANITAKQERIIRYWSVGGVLRWNEIMRALVAKHNRPPYQNPDGTYPTPSAANPFANPEFPFSNPPYAARAYAYVSAAQHDALVATWFYKKQYARVAPFIQDNTLKVLIPKSTLPSYPSEDGALCGVTVELLKLLFPTEIAFIQEKSAEHQLYRIIAGANVRSDIDAGVKLGKLIAAKFIARASTDGAGAAIGTPQQWAQLEAETIAKGEIPWKSLEIPARPPMLPFYGKVKSFLISPAIQLANRPLPPPSTKSDLFKKELAELKAISTNQTKKNMEIVTFWADGVGTYTPPGHWNAIAAESFVEQNYSEVRWARNMALLNISMMDAAISCWDAKYTYFTPRPTQVDPSIKTNTGVPNFPAYVSGHSTFSAAASTILSHLIPNKKTSFDAMAREASLSRMLGCIHYRSDCEKGFELGQKVGDQAIQRAKTDGAE